MINYADSANSAPARARSLALLFAASLVFACSSKSSSSRGVTTVSSSDSSKFEDSLDPQSEHRDVPAPPSQVCGVNLGLSGSKPQDRPSECGEGFESAYLYSSCVEDTAGNCTSVRFGANIKTKEVASIRFAQDTVATLDIKESAWTFQDLPEGVTCQSTLDGYRFNPLCSGSSSLKDLVLKAALNIKTGSKIMQGAIAQKPSNIPGTNFPNFMKLSADSGILPTNILYDGATSKFSEVWLDLISGRYLTNTLYNGSGTTNWIRAKAICEGIGDGWKLPTREDMCGDSDSNNHCLGGLVIHGFRNFALPDFNVDNSVYWSAKQPEANLALYFVMKTAEIGVSDVGYPQFSVVCIK